MRELCRFSKNWRNAKKNKNEQVREVDQLHACTHTDTLTHAHNMHTHVHKLPRAQAAAPKLVVRVCVCACFACANCHTLILIGVHIRTCRGGS